MTTKKIIQSFINGNKVAMFSKSFCPFCDMAKKVLSKAGVKNLAVLELDLLENGSKIQDELVNFTKMKTVPQVFINEKFIGGGTDVKKLFESGKLLKQLK